MKRYKIVWVLILVAIIPMSTVFALSIPRPTSEFYIGDFAKVLSKEAKSFIISTNLNYEKTDEKPQIVVVTTGDISGSYLEEYSVKLFEEWKIGNKDFDNGVLILLSLDEIDRGIRIEVGYGLEGRITDSKAGRILDEVMPHLEEGNYSNGLLKAFRLVAQEVNDEYGFNHETIFGDDELVHYSKESGDVNPKLVAVLIVLGIILLWADHRFLDGLILSVLLRSLLSGSRRGGGGGGGGSHGGGGRSGGGGASRRF